MLKQAIAATRVLAELKGRADEIFNQAILVNAITLQEAKDSSEIENIVTTEDNLYQAFTAKTNDFHQSNPSSPSLLMPVQILWSPSVKKSVQPAGIVLSNTSKDEAASNTMAPLVNIINSQGAQMSENSETALNP